MVLTGLICFAVSCFVDTDLTADSAGGQFVMSQLLRGFGQILAFMPLNQMSVGALPPEDAPDAAGLYNMARNLGGSLGLALLGVFIDRRVEAHADYIGQSVSQNSGLAQSTLAGQAAAFAAGDGGDRALGGMQAMAALSATVRQQALIMTYSECFWLLGVSLVVMMPLVLLLRPPPQRGAPAREMAH
jgi:DHA2 family multidrug resistance protein